jgi:hypothetical protein
LRVVLGVYEPGKKATDDLTDRRCDQDAESLECNHNRHGERDVDNTAFTRMHLEPDTRGS